MITYEWLVERMDVLPQEGGETDVVVTVYWKLNGTNGEYNGSVYGSVTLSPYEPGEPFTPYEELTQEQVLGWVFEALGDLVPQYEASVATQIQNQIKPPVITPPLPWSQS